MRTSPAKIKSERRGNLLAAAIHQDSDPSRSRLLSLESRLIRANSTWELYNPSNPLLRDEDDCARAVLDGIPYVSAKQIGFGEYFVASKIRKMLDEPSCNRFDIRSSGLSESQFESAKKILRSSFSILTGGPGTGKTYTLRALAESLEGARVSVRYAAPTGTAAKRITQSIGRPAQTCHRLLDFHPKHGFRVNEENPLDCDYVVIDESTMIDSPLFYAIMKGIGDARLILVGDRNQLPPIFIGSPFHSLVDVVPTAHLTEVRRTDPDGPIGMACQYILNGRMPEQSKKGESGFFVIQMSQNNLTDYTYRCAKKMNHNVHNVGILSPFNHSCERLNKYFLDSSHMDNIGPYPIMCLRNDYEEDIFNGEVGLSETFPCSSFKFEDRRIYFQPWRDTLAFARTIHKSQGGEWEDVIFHNPNNKFVTRNLVYTGVSRGKRRVAVVGCMESFKYSLADGRVDKRVSLLSKLVTGEAKIHQ